jgi:hypothetical protein
MLTVIARTGKTRRIASTNKKRRSYLAPKLDFFTKQRHVWLMGGQAKHHLSMTINRNGPNLRKAAITNARSGQTIANVTSCHKQARKQCATNQISIKTVEAVPSVGVVVRSRLLCANEIHDLVLAFARNLDVGMYVSVSM